MAEDFLDQAFPEPANAEPEAAPQEVVEQAAEAPTPEPEPVAEPEPVVDERPDRPDPGYVPIAAMMDERDKRKALEAEVARYRQQAEQQQPQNVPDPYDDPEGFRSYYDQQMENRLQQQRVDMSWHMAVQQHGAEAAEAAKNWALQKAQSDPMFAQQVEGAMRTQPLPIDWVIQQHKRDALLTDIGDPSKLDDWFAREAAKRGYAMQSAAPVMAPAMAVPASKPAMPPRSIASDATVPSAAVPENPMAAMDAIFNKR